MTRILARLLGPHAERDDLVARLVGAIVAAGLIAVVGVMVGDQFEFLSLHLALAYLVVAPMVALVTGRHFPLAQAVAAVTIYVVTRVHERFEPWEACALLAEQALWFALLRWMPIERIGVRRTLIATTTLLIVPVCWWLNVHRGTPIEVFLGAWRQFVLLMVVTASANRSAIATVRNLALSFFMSAPIPLENANTPDRRLVTLLAGGLIFAIGLVSVALFREHLPHIELDWDDGLPWLAGSCIVYMLAITVRVGAFGCMLMGHCYLLGVRVPAPIMNPLRWTNLGAAWSGMGVYMYRFAYDGFYRQFLPRADKYVLGTFLKIVGLFAIVGYMHIAWSGPMLSWTAAAIYLTLGISTGLTIVYLRRRSDARMRAYLRDRRPPQRSAWGIALAPLCIAAVTAFRGILEYGLKQRGFATRLAALVGISR